MSVVNILINTGILLACSIIQVFGVLVEGISKLFAKFGEYLSRLHNKLITQIRGRTKTKKTVDVNL